MNLLDIMDGATPPKVPPAPPVRRAAPAAKPAPRTFTPRTVRPMWRNGAPVPGSDTGYVVLHIGDLRWLIHGYNASGQPLGRWFRWGKGRECEMWICIDPGDATGINAHPDTPPAMGGVPS